MRPLMHGDVSNAARALLAAPKGRREALCRDLIGQAEAAHRYMRETGRLHPRWGNGSLMSAARRLPLADEPGFDDAEYCRCFEIVLSALVAHQVSRRRN